MTYRCWAEIDLAALRGNLEVIRCHVGSAVKVITVVKADAYGHGLREIAAHLMQSGTDIFGVANVAEARLIRRVGRGWPILMLGSALPGEIDDIVRDDVMATVSSLAEARSLAKAAERLHRPVRVHLKVDTGMGRLGAAPAQAAPLAAAIRRLRGVELCGLYTHFAAAEDDATFSALQRQRFDKVVREIRSLGIEPIYLHANNSAALLLEPASIYNTIRPGLLVYGVLPAGRRRIKASMPEKLRPAMTWKCRVAFVKRIAAGTSLSYGRQFVATRNMRVATIAAGYGDGYPRAATNRAYVLIRGQRCRVLGRVTMDQTIVDVSALTTVASGDEVVLLGEQRGQRISAQELASWCGSIPWEILTGISYRVPRVYRGGAAA